jgi:hypothetical protein
MSFQPLTSLVSLLKRLDSGFVALKNGMLQEIRNMFPPNEKHNVS